MLKTFPIGGVHPPENKLSADKPIADLPLPSQVIIPISQHIGAPSVPEVEKGQTVKAGQLISSAKGYVSANIHSSVSGKVNKIDLVADSSGYKQTCVVIDVEGDDWLESIDRDKRLVSDIRLSGEEIIKKCLESGIVGLGGATFPSHVKLSIPQGKKCEVLIINGVECEPYLTSDHRLMLEKPDEIITGIRLLMKALNVEKAMIGIESNKPDAIAILTEKCLNQNGISVNPLEVKYPQGGEKQLIKALIKREVPSGGLPIDVGTVVHNIGTAFAVYEAVQKNKPLFERVVTITGKSVSNPGNYRVRVGTPVSHLIEAAGGIPETTGKIVNGGPMMGKALDNPGVPVVKGTSGIILFDEQESKRSASGPCIRCSRCITACAMGLEPYLLMVLSERSLFEKAEAERITDCMECGSCSYICPAGRPLLDYIRFGKAKVMKMMRERNAK
ncbi:MAG: electron transport complex subunit RsxC [Bacteroidales bacterium]